MNDADLLDLLAICEEVVTGLDLESQSIAAKVHYGRADRMISSFRTAIRQRMDETANERTARG